MHPPRSLRRGPNSLRPEAPRSLPDNKRRSIEILCATGCIGRSIGLIAVSRRACLVFIGRRFLAHPNETNPFRDGHRSPSGRGTGAHAGTNASGIRLKCLGSQVSQRFLHAAIANINAGLTVIGGRGGRPIAVAPAGASRGSSPSSTLGPRPTGPAAGFQTRAGASSES